MKIDNDFYESFEKIKKELMNLGLSIRDFDIKISNKENDKVSIDIKKHRIIFTYRGEILLKSKFGSDYCEPIIIEDICLRKSYDMENEEKARKYYNQINTLEDLLNSPIFGFNTLKEDLIQELEMELNNSNTLELIP